MPEPEFLEQACEIGQNLGRQLDYLGIPVAIGSTAAVAYDKLTPATDIGEDPRDKNIEVYNDSVSMFNNLDESYSEEALEEELQDMEVPYNVTEAGLPQTENDLEKIQDYIRREPAKAAKETHLVNQALDRGIDVRKYLND